MWTKKKWKEYLHKYYLEHKDKYLRSNAVWYPKHGREYNRKYARVLIKNKYGLTLEQVDKILISQDHKCALCGKSLKETKRCIDHDHKTGKVRGILCVRCNLTLGFIEDGDIHRLKKIFTYLGIKIELLV